MEDFLTNMYIQSVEIFMATATPYTIKPGPGVNINKLPENITDYVYHSITEFKHILDGNAPPPHTGSMTQIPTLNQAKEKLQKKMVVGDISSHIVPGYISPIPQYIKYVDTKKADPEISKVSTKPSIIHKLSMPQYSKPERNSTLDWNSGPPIIGGSNPIVFNNIPVGNYNSPNDHYPGGLVTFG